MVKTCKMCIHTMRSWYCTYIVQTSAAFMGGNDSKWTSDATDGTSATAIYLEWRCSEGFSGGATLSGCKVSYSFLQSMFQKSEMQNQKHVTVVVKEPRVLSCTLIASGRCPAHTCCTSLSHSFAEAAAPKLFALM